MLEVLVSARLKVAQHLRNSAREHRALREEKKRTPGIEVEREEQQWLVSTPFGHTVLHGEHETNDQVGVLCQVRG